ncbi:MAG: nucleotidyltransferase domain-containing protein [Candidatus Eisenbacteria sp.]|nr:nucleotidyltransferase domain-containing protein [Candidatus Eisenbacteria bacterium]
MDSPGSEIAGIVDRYRQQLGLMGISVVGVILFGSRARGEASEGSDIDLLIVSPDFEPMTTRERLELLGVAAARLWEPIEALACTPDELAHAEPATLLEDIAQKGLRVA